MNAWLDPRSALRRTRHFVRRRIRFTRTLPTTINITPKRVDILGRGGFVGPAPVRLKISRGDELGLCFGVWIRPGRSGALIQTLLDFTGGKPAGCFLLLATTRTKEMQTTEIQWQAGGVKLVHAVPVGRWTWVFGGYDASGRRCWLSIDGGKEAEGFVSIDPFENIPHSFHAGLGCRLGSRHSDFTGTMYELGITSVIDHHTKADWQRWALAAAPNRAIEAETASQPHKWPTPWGHRVVFDSRRETVDVKRQSLRTPSDLARDGDEQADTLKRLADVEAAFTGFVETARTEDAVGVAYYFGRLVESNLPVRALTIGAGRLAVEVSTGWGGVYRTAEDLMMVDSRGFRGFTSFALRGMVAGVAQTFYRRAERPNARALLEGYQRKFGSDYLLADVDMAQSRHEREVAQSHPLVKTLACGGLDYLDYFKGRYCGNPFGDFEVRSDGEIFVCCPSYLPHAIGNLETVSGARALHTSPQLARIHNSIRNQTFQYCRWLHCEKIMGDRLPMKTAASPDAYEPQDVRLSYDPSCNLWCPSCRTEKIVLKRERQDELVRWTDDTVLPLLKSAKTVMMNGYGDIFSSRACRHILANMNRLHMPDLWLRLITNGVIFASEWEKFPNIHDMVESIRVSVDAARETTYNAIRPGGDWHALNENLKFISSLRRSGRIANFSVSFVVQRDNFTEMADFALLAQRLKCDEVIYEGLLNWNTFGIGGYRERAVHFPDHPLYPAFREEWAHVEEMWASPHSDAQNPLPALSHTSLAIAH